MSNNGYKWFLDSRYDDELEALEQTISACTGPCQQGRAPCPTPYACEVSQEDADAVMSVGWWVAEKVAMIIGIGLVIAIFTGVI